MAAADQRARQLVRQTEEDFSIFRREYTVALEVLEKETYVVDRDEIADQIAAQIRELGFPVAIQDIQKLVVRALKSCK